MGQRRFQRYAGRVGIVTTHGYFGLQGQRSVPSCSNTQYLWDELGEPNPNLRFMLSGHVHGETRRVDPVDGRSVFQLLADSAADYQERRDGGEGWLRILRFVPGDDKLYVQTFSPWLNQFETDADSEFTLDFTMGGSFMTSRSVSVRSGSTASVVVPRLAPNTEYEWRATVSGAEQKRTVGRTWRFTTGPHCADVRPTERQPRPQADALRQR